MKQEISRKSDDELRKYPLKDIVPGWSFRIDEISQGFYRVEGIDRWGRIVSRDGVDPDRLVEECKREIGDILSKLNNE